MRQALSRQRSEWVGERVRVCGPVGTGADTGFQPSPRQLAECGMPVGVVTMGSCIEVSKNIKNKTVLQPSNPLLETHLKKMNQRLKQLTAPPPGFIAASHTSTETRRWPVLISMCRMKKTQYTCDTHITSCSHTRRTSRRVRRHGRAPSAPSFRGGVRGGGHCAVSLTRGVFRRNERREMESRWVAVGGGWALGGGGGFSKLRTSRYESVSRRSGGEVRHDDPVVASEAFRGQISEVVTRKHCDCV